MFYGCSSLESLDISGFDTSLVTNMNSMFFECNSLEILDLSSFNTSLVTNLNSMFYGCRSLEMLDLSNFDTSLVTNMNSLFYGCEFLKYIDISQFNLTITNNSDLIFEGVDKLNYINLYFVQDPKKMLSDIRFNLQPEPIVCQKLDQKIILNSEAKCCYFNITEIKCESSNYIVIFFGKDTLYSKGFANNYRKDIQFLLVQNNHSKISSEEELFIKSGSKLEIYYSSPVESLENYFNKEIDINMENVVSIELSNFDTSKVTNMKSTFYGCSSLKSLDLSHINTSLVANMNWMLSECNSLESIDLSHFDISSVIFMNYMFSGCSSLLSVDLSNSEANKVTSTVEMFNECKSLRYINLKKINTSHVTNMNYMFSGCRSLEYLDISHFSSTKATKIESMFEEVTNLKYLSLYKAEDINKAISSSILTNLNNLTVCQKEKILVGDNLIDKCCKYNIEKNECEYVNYITVYYGEYVKYQNGFRNNNRKDIVYTINVGDNEEQNDTEFLNIEKNVPVKISFKSPLTSLIHFFDIDEDQNSKKIISIDFSNFDSSKIESLGYLFYGCSALKSIDFSYFTSSLVNNMESMFDGCSSLELVDLSNFDFSLVTSMKNMFKDCSSLKTIDLSSFNTPSLNVIDHMFFNCSSLESIDLSNFSTSLISNFSNLFSECTKLKYLDISSFNFEKVDNLENLFINVPLKYLNISNINDPMNLIAKTELNDLINLTICQKREIFTKEDKNYQCCKYNIEKEKCEFSNYIIVYFEKETEYKYGFELDNSGKSITERKDKIDYILNGNDKNPIKGTQPFKVEANSKIDIFFTNITSLIHFFDYNIDANVENIISVDLSHLDSSFITDLGSLFSGCKSLQYIDFLNFDSSKVTNMESMFSGCTSLLSIYLSNFVTSSVENMASMFSGCSQLESIDLSSFNTSLVTDMTSLFSDCDSLKILDISNFNMENVNKSESMFSGVNNLQYINIYNMIDSQNIIGQSELKNLADLIICGQASILNKETSKCCYYDYFSDNKGCLSTNYMIIYYGNDAEYPNGFQNKFRNDSIFIINGDQRDKMNITTPFNIYAGNKITIYFDSPIKSLESFFDINYDPNVEKIISIDLTHFDFSEITDMNNMFVDCSSLESIIFPDINTSKIYNMKRLFFGCSRLLSVNLFALNTDEVTDISYMFYDCSSLQFLNFSNFNTSKVTKMNNIFYRCNSLEIVDLSPCETPLLTNLEKMFYKCKNLKEINLANFTTSSVISMDEMFYDCISLTFLDISNFDMINCTYYSNMFSNISSIRYINLQNFKNDKVIASIFNQTKDLFVCQKEEIIVNPNVYYCCNYNFETKECESIQTSIISTIPSFIPYTSNINTQISDIQDINPSNQNTDEIIYSNEKESYPPDSTEESDNLNDSENFSETKEIHFTEYFTKNSILSGDTTIIDKNDNTSMVEENPYNEENTDNYKHLTDNRNEKTYEFDSKEYDTSYSDGKEMKTSSDEAQETSIPKPLEESQEISIPKPLEESQEISIPKPLEESQEISIPKPLEKSQEISIPKPLEESQEISIPKPLEESQETSIPKPLEESQETSIPKPLEESQETSIPKPLEESQETSNPKIGTKEPINSLESSQESSDKEDIPTDQMTNIPSINIEHEPSSSPSNKQVVQTNIPTSLNLTSLSTNLVENSHGTIIENIVQCTEVLLIGLSHIEILEKIVKFFIYFNLNSITASSKTLQFPLELISRRVLRVLETQEAICELVDDEGRTGMCAYLCEVEITSNQAIKGIKIINAFKFSSQNFTISSGISPLMEQHMDNILEIGNEFDFLLNSTLYTLENSKIGLGENLVFNISGIINDPKPKFGKVDLLLSVSAEYEGKNEVKQIECSIIDIIGNKYILNCTGMKNTKISLNNSFSFIEKEALFIQIDPNENGTILYNSDDNKNNFSVRSINKKSGNIGVGAIIAIILACLAAVAVIIISYIYFKKRKNQPQPAPESTVANLAI
jgi:surface protein